MNYSGEEVPGANFLKPEQFAVNIFLGNIGKVMVSYLQISTFSETNIWQGYHVLLR